jgi:hypothetical protein
LYLITDTDEIPPYRIMDTGSLGRKVRRKGVGPEKISLGATFRAQRQAKNNAKITQEGAQTY